EAASKLTAGYLQLQNDCAPLVQPNQVKRVLTEVDPDRGDSFRRLLRCAHRRLLELCVTPPQPQPSRVGAGCGRAIPLGDIPLPVPLAWRRHTTSVSSKLLASFRSRVSKPSVNQPKTGARSSRASFRLA